MKKLIIPLLIATSLYALDNRAPSSNPPNNLSANQVPMFVSIGFDDNSHAGFTYPGVEGQSIHWIRTFSKDLKNHEGTGNSATFDGEPVRFSFFQNTCYMADLASDYPQQLKVALNMAYLEGHEIGNHTHSHITSKAGPSYSVSQWESEMEECNGWLEKSAPPTSDSSSISKDENTGAGVPSNKITGFRTPFLYFNDNMFSALSNLDFEYDCSIEDGYQDTIDGTNFLWPYTLDNGSPGWDYIIDEEIVSEKMENVTIGKHPGLWELPMYPVVVPPDSICDDYGIPSGLRQKMKNLHPDFDTDLGKITGLDYNMWYEYRLNKDEFLAILKYNFDLRYNGNRAPMLYGAHSQYYNALWNGGFSADVNQRMAAIEEFIAYVLTKEDVRVVPYNSILEWCKNPVPLRESSPVIATKAITKNVNISASKQDIKIDGLLSGSYKIFTTRGQILNQGEFKNGVIDTPKNISNGVYRLSLTSKGFHTTKSFTIK